MGQDRPVGLGQWLWMWWCRVPAPAVPMGLEPLSALVWGWLGCCTRREGWLRVRRGVCVAWGPGSGVVEPVPLEVCEGECNEERSELKLLGEQFLVRVLRLGVPEQERYVPGLGRFEPVFLAVGVWWGRDDAWDVCDVTEVYDASGLVSVP